MTWAKRGRRKRFVSKLLVLGFLIFEEIFKVMGSTCA
jgi:hypothetical protein